MNNISDIEKKKKIEDKSLINHLAAFRLSSDS